MGPDWSECLTPENWGCWLRHNDGREFNISTDYEKVAPIGVDRFYLLTVDDGWVNTDGMNSTAAKLSNNTYPGPWIQACWGDVSLVSDLVALHIQQYVKLTRPHRLSTSTSPT